MTLVEIWPKWLVAFATHKKLMQPILILKRGCHVCRRRNVHFKIEAKYILVPKEF